MVPEILSRISAPIFPDRDFLITSYGAVPDGETDNTDSFRHAIEECNALGGGRVVVPPVSFILFVFYCFIDFTERILLFVRVYFFRAPLHF